MSAFGSFRKEVDKGMVAFWEENLGYLDRKGQGFGLWEKGRWLPWAWWARRCCPSTFWKS
jgi:hypothetical protein